MTTQEQVYQIADYERFKSAISYRYVSSWANKLDDFTPDSRFTLEMVEPEYVTVRFVGSDKSQYIHQYFVRDYFVPVEVRLVDKDATKREISRYMENQGYFELMECFPSGFAGLHPANPNVFLAVQEHWQKAIEIIEAIIESKDTLKS